jgi:hypothetical protein
MSVFQAYLNKTCDLKHITKEINEKYVSEEWEVQNIIFC